MATIRPLKRKRGEAWLLSYKDPATGKYIREVLHVSKLDATIIKKKVEADIAMGKFNIQIDRPRTYNWQQLVDRYIPHSRRNKSPKTVKREQQTINAFSDFLNGTTYLKDFEKTTIETYRDNRLNTVSKRGKKISPATVSIELRILKTMFNMALEWKMLKENPVNRVSLPKKDIIKVRFLHIEEVESLLKVIEDANDLQFRDLVITYLKIGARRFELLAPQFGWDHIDMKARRILIDGKGLRKRYIPISDSLERVLNRVIDKGGRVPFDYHPDTVTHRLAKYLKLAGIQGANVHSLRKTFGSMLLQYKKMDLLTVSKLLGHAKSTTTETYYVDLLDSNLRDAVSGLDDLIPE